MKVSDIAKVCHQANKAYCESLGDNTQNDWEDAKQWQKDSAIIGVQTHLDGDITPEQTHIKWMEFKLNDGWVYGEEKNAELKTHPCLVPYDQLPIEQQKKDKLFKAIVESLKDN